MQKKNALWALAAIIVIVAVAAFVMKGPSTSPSDVEPAAGVQVASKKEAMATDDLAMPGAVGETQATTQTAAATSAPTDIDVQAVLADRALGNPDAKIVIREFASLACSHCANFAKTTWPALMEEYVDTGKVYFIYSDFPLNASSLDAAIVARCMPEDSYFRYIKFLFETQDEWAFADNYRTMLLQNAKLLGASEDRLQACLNNQEIRGGLIARLEEFRGKHNLQSTPSFIINDKEVLVGYRGIEDFRAVIDPLLEGAKAE